MSEFTSTYAPLGLAAMILILLADGWAEPRGRRSIFARSFVGTSILLLVAMIAFALMLILTGAPLVSQMVVVALMAALSMISNIKRKVLGEPLVFSDFALIGAVFQHPQFYFSAMRPGQIVILVGGLATLIVTLIVLSSADFAPRLVGVVLALVAGVGLWRSLWNFRKALPARVPDPDADVQCHGLAASLLTYWQDWCQTPDLSPCQDELIPGQSRQLVVVVQCESFTDPVELFGQPALALQGLEAARRIAWQAGRLLVSGFGAYTMRTEYGVLFGRDERTLGTRRFDPFLTAHRDSSWALPNRLDHSEWARWFVHPHDMRFYGRHRIMPKAGFGALVGEDCFAPPAPHEGRYVTDAAITDQILELAQERTQAGFVYAVTIENHGPWPPGKLDEPGASAPYLDLLSHSDAMLARLLEELPRIGRPVTLCFFGDHRPSIPAVSVPGPERSTPYVILRFAADGRPISGNGLGLDITPAELHSSILAAIRLGEAER